MTAPAAHWYTTHAAHLHTLLQVDTAILQHQAMADRATIENRPLAVELHHERIDALLDRRLELTRENA